jgi:serine/threonine protein phosphatase PrpC
VHPDRISSVQADVLRGQAAWAAKDVTRALKDAFLQLDREMATACPSSSGTTCTLAVLQGYRLAVGGVGDSK